MARATREIGLIRGERIVRGGYTHSVYTELPKLFERAGVTTKGSITAFYTVLCADERDIDPLREEIISLVDGHIILDQSLANKGLYPAIAPLRSLSRLGGSLMSEEQGHLKAQFSLAWARLERDRDIGLFGGRPDAELRRILACEPMMLSFLTQSEQETIPLAEGLDSLRRVCSALQGSALSA
jgi:type III secretion protein N (ATPase)